MHPHHAHRQHKVQHSRVAHITKGYASGGAVHDDAAEDAKMIKRMVKPKALKGRMHGGQVKARADRPQRARGGKVKGKGKTVVNVNVMHPQHLGTAMAPQNPPSSMPPRPVPAPPPPMAGPPPGLPAGLPPGLPPGMPPRAKGGRVDGTKVYRESMHAGTQVQHSPGKNDTKNIGRKKPITYQDGGRVKRAAGGPIYSSAKGHMAPHLPGGAGGGLARLKKSKMVTKGGMAP